MQKHDKERMEHLDAPSREMFLKYRSIAAKMRKYALCVSDMAKSLPGRSCLSLNLTV